jgi:uncharacterized membrane protein
MTSKNNKVISISTAVCLLPIVMYLVVYDRLPAQMGMQWNIEGDVNWYAPKAVAVFVAPAVLALLHLFSAIARRNDPRRESTSAAMQVIKDWTIPIVSILIAVYSILQNTGISVSNAVPLAVIGIILIVVGNYIPKNRQNYTLGIRTPWALNNADNWNKTHRLAGRLWISGGIVLIVSGFLVRNTPELLMVLAPIVILLAAAPVIYSFCLYKKHVKDNILDKNE